MKGPNFDLLYIAVWSSLFSSGYGHTHVPSHLATWTMFRWHSYSPQKAATFDLRDLYSRVGKNRALVLLKQILDFVIGVTYLSASPFSPDPVYFSNRTADSGLMLAILSKSLSKCKRSTFDSIAIWAMQQSIELPSVIPFLLRSK